MRRSIRRDWKLTAFAIVVGGIVAGSGCASDHGEGPLGSALEAFGVDAGMPGADAGMPDTGIPSKDAGAPKADASPPDDAGTLDAGTPDDAGVPGDDGGVVIGDAGIPGDDGGVVIGDAGTPGDGGISDGGVVTASCDAMKNNPAFMLPDGTYDKVKVAQTIVASVPPSRYATTDTQDETDGPFLNRAVSFAVFDCFNYLDGVIDVSGNPIPQAVPENPSNDPMGPAIGADEGASSFNDVGSEAPETPQELLGETAYEQYGQNGLPAASAYPNDPSILQATSGELANPLNILRGLPRHRNPADYRCDDTGAGADPGYERARTPNLRSADNWEYVYVPGIQGYDPDTVMGWIRYDDVGTANRYNAYAFSGAQNNDPTRVRPNRSNIGRWKLFYYYNNPARLNGGAGPSRQLAVKRYNWPWQANDRQNIGSVESWGWPGRPTWVDNQMKAGAPVFVPAGRDSDKNQVRTMAAWILSPNFLAAGLNPRIPPVPATTVLPAMLANPRTNPQMTTASFNATYTANMRDAGWRTLMRNMTYWIMKSYACQKPFFAHSGAGPLAMWSLTMLNEYSRANGNFMNGWNANVPWFAVGLEEVVAASVVARIQAFPAFANRLRIQNHIENSNAQGGSDTWRNTIAREITNVGEVPFVSNRTNMNCLRFTEGALGHAWIGFTPLEWGDLRNPPTQLLPQY